jgi:hypothetical protein
MRKSLTCIAVALASSASADAQRWCSNDAGTLSADTTFVAADTCPAAAGDKLKLFRWSELLAATWTTPFQLPTPSDFVTITDSGAGTIFNLGEDVGLEVFPQLTITSSDANVATMFGHFALPGSLPLPGGTCRAGSMATAGSPPSVYLCEGGATWRGLEFGFTGTLQWSDPGDSFQLNNSFGQPVFGLTPSSVELGKPLSVDVVQGASSASSITLGSNLSILGVASVRVGLGGSPFIELSTSYVELGFSSGNLRLYGARATAPSCTVSLLGSTYFDTDTETQCICKTPGWDPAGSCA